TAPGARCDRDPRALAAVAAAVGGGVKRRGRRNEALPGSRTEAPARLHGGRARARVEQAPQARSRYSPVRVSTLIGWPGSMCGGTWTTSPVSSVAGFELDEAVAPRRPGGVSTTLSTTVV